MFGRSSHSPPRLRSGVPGRSVLSESVSRRVRTFGGLAWLALFGVAPVCLAQGQDPVGEGGQAASVIPASAGLPAPTGIPAEGEALAAKGSSCAERIADHVDGLEAVRGNRRGGDPQGAELAERWIAMRGRPVPPGLPAERTAVLRSESDSAILQLAGQSHEELLSGIAHILEDAEASGEAWIRAVDLTGELELWELGSNLIEAFARAPETFQGGRLRRALYELTGLWTDPIGQESFFPANSFPGTATVMGRLAYEFKAKEDERRALLRQLWALDRSLLIESLGDESPMVRAEAARGLATPPTGTREELNLSSGGAPDEPSPEEREAVLELLLEAVCAETDLHAACEQLLTIGELVEASGLTPQQAPAVLEVLEGFLESGPPELLHAVTRSAVDWLAGDAAEALARRSEWVLRALRRLQDSLAISPGPSPVHPDVLVATLDAVGRLARESRGLSAEDPSIADSFRRADLVDAVQPLLVGADVPSEVRLAAVSTMRFLAGPEDLPALRQVFDAYPEDTALQFALVGVFEEVSRAAEVKGESGALTAEQSELLGAIARDLLGADSLDLRRRAHDLLLSQALLGPLAQKQIHKTLASEPDLELSIDLIELLLMGELGDPAALLDARHISAVFGQRPDLLDAWVEQLTQAAERSPLEDLNLAARFHGLALEGNSDRVAGRCLQLALRPELGEPSRLAMRIDAGESGLAAEQHLLLVTWADELAADPLGVSRTEESARLVRTVLDHHLEPARGLLPAEEADYLVARLTVAARAPYDQLYPALERALESASSAGGNLREVRLLAARVLSERPEREALAQAVDLYGQLNTSASDQLEVGDRRRLFEALLKQARLEQTPEGDPAALESLADRAVSEATVLVQMPSWYEGDPAVAFEDLERFHDAIVLSGKEAGLELLGSKLYDGDTSPTAEGEEPRRYSVLESIQEATELGERLAALRAKISDLENIFAEQAAQRPADGEVPQEETPEEQIPTPPIDKPPGSRVETEP